VISGFAECEGCYYGRGLLFPTTFPFYRDLLLLDGLWVRAWNVDSTGVLTLSLDDETERADDRIVEGRSAARARNLNHVRML